MGHMSLACDGVFVYYVCFVCFFLLADGLLVTRKHTYLTHTHEKALDKWDFMGLKKKEACTNGCIVDVVRDPGEGDTILFVSIWERE